MANELGKRYTCDVCSATVLCAKAGSGGIVCDGKPMTLQQPRQLPSSD
ncbi:MAG: hypothetical protein EXR48_06745 [Dehalococcoidia bacterium]|nr:hypothetical protein [Dehalococcoidia bacterium]